MGEPLIPPGTDLCKLPAGQSPDGVSNFDNPPSLGPALLAVGITLGVLSTGIGVGRLYINRSRLHMADYFTLLGVLFNLGFIGVIESQYKFHRHIWDTPVCWYTAEYLKLPFVQTVLFSPAYFFPKAAIFLLYRQLFVVERTTRWAIHLGILTTLLVYLSNIPLAAFYTAPRPGQSWDSLLVSLQANSRPFALAGVVQSAVGTGLDLYTFFLPLPILARLQMERKRRIQLFLLFSTALLGVAASIVSIVFKARILSSGDSSWHAAEVSLVTIIETNIAIIVGSLPAFSKILTRDMGSGMFRSLRSRLLGSSGRQKNSSSGASNGQIKDPNKRSLVTFGANQTPRRNKYRELGDSILLESQVTTKPDPVGDEEYEMDPRASNERHEPEVHIK